MTPLKITAKGQVTLRKEVLRDLGVTVGDKVMLEKLADGGYALRPPQKGDISDAFDLLRKPGRRALSLEEIKRITENAWAGKR